MFEITTYKTFWALFFLFCLSGFSVPHGNASLIGNDTDTVDYETIEKQGTVCWF